MNSIVCSVTLICLGNVAGFHLSPEIHQKPATPVVHPPTDNIDISDSSLTIYTCYSKTKRDHQWYHVYPNGFWQPPTYIGNIPTQTSVRTTHFAIKLETFDNNTEIQCDRNSWFLLTTTTSYPIISMATNQIHEALNPTLGFPVLWGPVSFNPYSDGTVTKTVVLVKDNQELAVLKYNETRKVRFTCQEYKDKTNLLIGVINTNSNMIKTYKSLQTIKESQHNETVLCCIYYEVTGTTDEKVITRHVAKKTLLVYDETVTVPVTDRQDSSEDKGEDAKSPDADLGIQDSDSGRQDADSGKQDTDSGKQDADSGKQEADSGKQEADSDKQDADSGKQDADSGKQDADSGKQDADTGNQVSDPSNQGSIIEVTIIYTVSAVAVVFILIVVPVIYLKHCRKKPKVEVETKVLYVDLDFLRRNEPESLPRKGPHEESPYAEIIGELRPQ